VSTLPLSPLPPFPFFLRLEARPPLFLQPPKRTGCPLPHRGVTRCFSFFSFFPPSLPFYVGAESLLMPEAVWRWPSPPSDDRRTGLFRFPLSLGQGSPPFFFFPTEKAREQSTRCFRSSHSFFLFFSPFFFRFFLARGQVCCSPFPSFFSYDWLVHGGYFQ